MTELDILTKYGTMDLKEVEKKGVYNPLNVPMEKLVSDLQTNVVRFVYRKAKKKDEEWTLDLLMKDLVRVAIGTRNPTVIKESKLKVYKNESLNLEQTKKKAITEIKSLVDLVVKEDVKNPSLSKEEVDSLKKENKERLVRKQNEYISELRTIETKEEIITMLSALFDMNFINGNNAERSEAMEKAGGYIKYFDLEENEFRMFRYEPKDGDFSTQNRLLACDVTPRGTFKGLSWKLFDINDTAWFEIVNYLGENKEEDREYLTEVRGVLRNTYEQKQIQNKIYKKYENGTNVTAKTSNNKHAEKIMAEDYSGKNVEELNLLRETLDDVKNKDNFNELVDKKNKTLQAYIEGRDKWLKDIETEKIFLTQEYLDLGLELFELIKTFVDKFDNSYRIDSFKKSVGLTQVVFGEEMYAISPIFILNAYNGTKHLDQENKKLFKLGRARVTEDDNYVEPFIEALISYINSADITAYGKKKVAPKVVEKPKKVGLKLTEDDFKRYVNAVGFVEGVDSGVIKAWNPSYIKVLKIDKEKGLIFNVGIGTQPFILNANGLYVQIKDKVTLIHKKHSDETYNDFVEAIVKNHLVFKVYKKGFDKNSELNKVEKALGLFLTQGFMLRKKLPNKTVFEQRLSKYV